MRNVRRDLALVLAVASLAMAPGPALSLDEPSFGDLAGVATDTPAVVREGDVLRVRGTVTAGRNDPISKNEYFLALVGSDVPSAWRRFALGPYVAQLDLTLEGGTMAHGEQRTISAELSLASARKWKDRFVALAWMEKDFGLGIGSVDTPFLFLAGGAPDKVAATGWLSLEALARGPVKVEFGPTLTGGRMSLVLQVVPGKN